MQGIINQSIFFVCLLIISSLSSYFAPSLVVAQVDTSNFLTYTNTDHGFTMKYPSDWVIDDSNITNGIRFTSPYGLESGQVIVNVGETGLSAEDYAKMAFSGRAPGFKWIEINTNTYFLSGHHAVRMIGLIQNAKFMVLVTTVGGKGYFVGYQAIPERFADNLQTAQTMIDSFQIISKR